jgi:hypothetical protein
MCEYDDVIDLDDLLDNSPASSRAWLEKEAIKNRANSRALEERRVKALEDIAASLKKFASGLLSDARLGQECETLIALKSHFTGEPPYVGNKGVLLALRESLDELNRLK